MAKESSFTLRICDWVTKYSIYAAIFLAPVFFLPWTAEVLDFNKQTLLLLLAVAALFSWMLRVLISGKFEVNISKMHIVAAVLFLVYLLSTIFSVNRYGSFWGWPQSSSESLLTLLAVLLFYFLVSNVFSKRNTFTAAVILSFSAVLAELLGILQLLGLFIIPFNFAKFIAFNTVGSVGSLGFFAAIMLPLATTLLILSRKWWKVLFILEIILSALILFLVNYSIIWWVVVAGSAVIMFFGIMKRDIFDGRWMALPMFFLAVSLFFVLLSPQFPGLTQRANEIFLSQRASLEISLRAIKENPIFGSGPGTFGYDFSKFKNQEFSKGPLWNITFNRASSKVLNDLATTGILGFLVLLAFILLPVFFGVKFLISEKTDLPTQAEKKAWILALGLFSALLVCGATYFLYNPNVTLSFVFFFVIASLVSLTAENKREYELKPSSLLTLAATFVFTLVFIFGLGLIILNGQRYVAEVSYYKGLVSWRAEKIDEGIKNLESAASMNPASDIYFSQLSQAYLLKLQQELQNTTGAPSDEEKNKIQTLVANSINAGKIATDLNPKSVSNWSLRGYVYQNLFGIISDAETWAITSYDEALKLDPYSPYLFAQKGNVFFATASSLAQDKLAEKSQALSQAKEQLEKSLNLNPDYSNALYSLGLVYDAMGEKSKAIEQFKKVQQLNPDNKDILKILNNAENPPTENPSGDNTVKNPPVEKK